MAQHPDVLVLGGGVIGLTVAYQLAREGVGVAVVDRGDFGREASWAGAGIIPPGNSRHARTPFDLLLARSSELFSPLSQELRERTGIDNGYVRCGGLEVDDGDGAAARTWREQGVSVEVLQADALRRLEPALAPDVARACHLPDLAQVRNPRHLKALLAGCAALDVALRPGCPVHELRRDGRRVAAVATDGGRLTAGRVVVAAGAWSDGLLRPLGFGPGVHPVRGQIALLNTRTRLFHKVIEHGKRYLVPRLDGRVLVGSTEEHAGFDKRTTAGAVRGLLDFALGLVPALDGAELERCWAGLRPGSPDGLPFLGPVPGYDNLFVAAGHFRSGIQLSAVTGQVVQELLLGRPPSVPLEAFRPDRAPPGASSAAAGDHLSAGARPG
jgi:glycine oxidase